MTTIKFIHVRDWFVVMMAIRQVLYFKYYYYILIQMISSFSTSRVLLLTVMMDPTQLKVSIDTYIDNYSIYTHYKYICALLGVGLYIEFLTSLGAIQQF